MRRSICVAIPVAIFVTIAPSPAMDDGPREGDGRAARVVAPGLVEPISEEIEIASDVIGRLKAVPVQEGDAIARGQILAEVENADLKAALAVANANVEKQQAELDKLRNGARLEERQEAAAELAEAAARESQAQRDLARKAPLAAVGVESRSKLDEASATATAASARRLALTAQQALVDGAPRPEDVRIAEAELAQAQANAAEIQSEIDRTIIRSPIDGVVLSRQRKAGEAVANLPPTVIMHIGDISRLRVRADVDETDIARVAVGQRVSVRTDAFGDRRFGGTIVRLAPSLGRKNFSTERPTEKVDTKILETLIDLDPEVRLPVGLRVDVLDESVAQKDQKQPDVSASAAVSKPSAAPVTRTDDPVPVPPTVASAPDAQARGASSDAQMARPVEGRVESAAPPSPIDVSSADPKEDATLEPLTTFATRDAGSDRDAASASIAPTDVAKAAAPRVEPASAAAAQPSPPPTISTPAPAPVPDTASTHAAYGAPIDASRIVLSAIQDTWVQISDSGGNPIFTRVLTAGEQYGVPDRKGLTLVAGNAAGLEISVDGTTLPPLGKPNRVVRDIRLDPQALLQRLAGIR